MSSWRAVEEWRDAWATFFSKERRATLSLLLDATSCREAWVQAEAHCHFRALSEFNFYCNTARLGRGGKKADFAEYSSPRRDARLRFIAEFKWLGAHYQPKVLTGHHAGLRKLQAAHPQEGPIRLSATSKAEPYYRAGGWSLLHDYFRLLHAPDAEPRTVRFLITLLDLRHHTELGGLLSRVELEGPPILDVPVIEDVRVRTWNITGQLRG